jgi:hypothetical protein
VNRTIAICAILCWLALWGVIAAAAPWILSDENSFFKNFVNHEFLAFMGVVVTITLSSAANLFIELNKMEEKLDSVIFRKSKIHVKDSAFALIGALVASIILVIVKPLLLCGHRSEAVLNGFAVTILIFSVLILVDLTQAAFSLDPRADD